MTNKANTRAQAKRGLYNMPTTIGNSTDMERVPNQSPASSNVQVTATMVSKSVTPQVNGPRTTTINDNIRQQQYSSSETPRPTNTHEHMDMAWPRRKGTNDSMDTFNLESDSKSIEDLERDETTERETKDEPENEKKMQSENYRERQGSKNTGSPTSQGKKPKVITEMEKETQVIETQGRNSESEVTQSGIKNVEVCTAMIHRTLSDRPSLNIPHFEHNPEDLTRDPTHNTQENGISIMTTQRTAARVEHLKSSSSLKLLAWTKVAEMHNPESEKIETTVTMSKGDEHLIKLRQDTRDLHAKQDAKEHLTTPEKPESTRELQLSSNEWIESSTLPITIPQDNPNLGGRRNSVGIVDQVIKDLAKMNAKLLQTRKSSQININMEKPPSAELYYPKHRSIHEVMTLETNSPAFESRNEEIIVSQKRCRRRESPENDDCSVRKKLKSQREEENKRRNTSVDSEDEDDTATSRNENWRRSTEIPQTGISNIDETPTCDEKIISKLSPILMSAATIAVAPLMKLYENLNENYRDQTTLIALLNSKMIKLETDLKEMTSEIVVAKRGNDISLMALKESLRNNSEDKKLLAEVTRQALTLLQNERERRRDSNITQVAKTVQTSQTSVINLETCELPEKFGTTEHAFEKKKKETEVRVSKQNCCYDKELIISHDVSDCGRTERKSVEIAQKTTTYSSTDCTTSIEKSVEESKQQIEKEPDKEQVLLPTNPPNTSKSIDTNSNNLESMPIIKHRKKNEREWYDIFENPKTSSGASNEKNSKTIKPNSNNCNKKSKNQQAKKNKKTRSSANFFRNIKALNITVNNSEVATLKGEKKKQIDEEIQIVEEKTQPANLTENNITLIERTIELDMEDPDGDEEELLNMSTYSVPEADENNDNEESIKIIENGNNPRRDNRELEASPQKSSIKGYEKEKDDRSANKRVILWPETPTKSQLTTKKSSKKMQEPQIFFTLEEKRLKSMLKQGNIPKIMKATKNTTLDERKNNIISTEILNEKSTRKIEEPRGNVDESIKSRNSTVPVGNKTILKNHQYRLLVEKIDGRQGGTPLNRYTILQMFQKIPVLKVIKSARIDRVEIMAEMKQKSVLLYINDKKDAELIMMSERQLLEAGYQVYEVDNTLKGNDDVKTKEPKAQRTNEKELVTFERIEKNAIREHAPNVMLKDTEIETEVAGLPDDIKTKKIKITVDNRGKLDIGNDKSMEVNADEDERKKWSWLAKSLNPIKES
ncbi:uncharacterized protein [Ambystoma mexicanum]|uniref:uncharacterized protein n=1 Tax=Ambystoma mexicanum TaxID=8296 RepID=UPI0037E7D6FF